MPVDLNVFDRQRTVLDQQALQQAFDLKKQMAIAQLQGAQEDRALKQQALAQGLEAPAAVREFQFYNQLPAEQQQQFLNVKRAAQLKDMGSGFGVYNPVQGNISPIQGGEITLDPTEQLKFDADTKAAEDSFNRGLEVKNKALESVYRLVGNPNAKVGTPEYEGNISGVRANRGGFSSALPNFSNSAVDAEADLTTLSNLLTTENLGLLKGVLSDTDMKVLASIGSGELQGSDKKALAALRKMRTALGSQVVKGRQLQQQGFDGGLPPNLSDPSFFIDAPVDSGADAKRMRLEELRAKKDGRLNG